MKSGLAGAGGVAEGSSPNEDHPMNGSSFGMESMPMMMQDSNKMVFTDAADEIMNLRKGGNNTPFIYHYFERPNAATDALNLARTLYDLREYRKCAHVLKPYANEKYQSALFLYNYALYIVSEH